MIKEIIVDLGGVYFTNGTKSVLPEISELINSPKDKIFEIFKSRPGKEGYLYRIGKLNRDEFWEKAKDKLKLNNELIIKLEEVWHSSYILLPGARELVRNLRKNYRVIVFSGNIKDRIEFLDKKYGLLKEFDDFIFSFDCGCNKGDKEFVDYLIKRIKHKPEECIYIDDHIDCLELAKPFGFKTILFNNINQLEKDLQQLEVKIT